jgi:hypothetical protein
VTTPLAPVSWGELLDKISILEIKAERMTAPAALANVRSELAQLNEIAREVSEKGPDLAALRASLKRINEALWQIEDDIRAKEAAGEFDARFIDLARAVYRNNDERGRLKREINRLLGSGLVEEKQYAAYPGASRQSP